MPAAFPTRKGDFIKKSKIFTNTFLKDMTKNGERSTIVPMKSYLASTIHLLFLTYTILIFIRIVISWFPAWYHLRWVHFVAFYTDPFLNIFRRILPPLGGVLDLSPLLAFFALRLLEIFVLSFFR